jgi:hypothetical protein
VRTIETVIEIAAPPESVWASLVDFAAYGSWNPFIRSIEGEPTPGARLKVRIEPPGRSGMTFKPTVLEAAPGRRLRWLGTVGVRGVLDGEHRFELEPLAGGRTRFTHSEQFRGVLVPVFAGMLADTRRGFEAMNAALKARVERSG